MSQGNEHIETREINGVTVEIFGCWDNDTPHDKYAFYDAYVDGECINLGEPYYEKPTDVDLAGHLELFNLLRS